MTELRKIPSEFPEVHSRLITLILIRSGGNDLFATSLSEKKAFARDKSKNDRIIAVWTGKWRSDAFKVGEETWLNWRSDLLE